MSRYISTTCATVLRLLGCFVVVLALQMPHSGTALANPSADQGTMDHAQMHGMMGQGDSGHKTMDLALCGLVCAGCVAVGQPLSDRLGLVVRTVVWHRDVVLVPPDFGPDPALRPPRTRYIL